MESVYGHMVSIARLGRVDVGLSGQQCVGIIAGAVCLIAELDSAEITLGPFAA
jgi:hypothetical protein